MTSQSSVCEESLRSEAMEQVENAPEEDETSLATPNSNPATVAVCSRRRLAFSRPQSAGKTSRISANGTGGGDTESRLLNDASALATPSKAALDLGVFDPQKARLCPGRKVASWNFQDMLLFYDGLKQHGKDFEAIAKHMNKKKVNKDRDQVRNYYFNAYKIWKSKAQMEESDWAAVPRDARELFVVLNGCEWRKRTNAVTFDAAKFKALILDGYTSVRTKRKKGSMIFIRTPYCPSLLRFFPYDKRYSEIPTHLNVQLTPQSYADRNYVISCEQNPLLSVQMNINDKLSSLFLLMRRKWITPSQRVANSFGGGSGSKSRGGEENKFILHVGEDTKIHKVQVDVNNEEGSFPTMSLRKLKRDYAVEEEMSNTTDGNSFGEADPTAAQRLREAPDNCTGNLIKLSSVKEVFDIDEGKIKDGLTEENCGNASILQLFYFCGMRKEIMLSYEVCRDAKSVEVEPWSLFLNLVSRDYGEVVSRSMQCTSAPSASASLAPTNHVQSLQEQREFPAVVETAQPQSGLISVRQPVSRQSVVGFTPLTVPATSSIVEEENLQFLRQLNELNQQQPKRKQAKRQVKLIPSAQRGRLGIYNRLCAESYATPVNSGSGGPPPLGSSVPQPAHPVTYFLATEPVASAYAPGGQMAGNSILVDSRQQPGEHLRGYHVAPSVLIPPHTQPTTQVSTSVEGGGLSAPGSALQPTDFSHLTVESSGRVICLAPLNPEPASSGTAQLVRPPAAHHSRTEPMGNDFSLDSTLSSFINNPINLDSSPNKTLPDDVRSAYEQCLKENSVDFCKNFEQLTARIEQTTQSPKRRVLAGSSAGKKGGKDGRKRAL